MISCGECHRQVREGEERELAIGSGSVWGGQGTVVQSRAISTRGGERSAWSWLRGDGEEM